MRIKIDEEQLMNLKADLELSNASVNIRLEKVARVLSCIAELLSMHFQNEVRKANGNAPVFPVEAFEQTKGEYL